MEVLVQSPKKAAREASMGYASEELLSFFLAPFGMFPKLGFHDPLEQKVRTRRLIKTVEVLVESP